MRDQGLHLRWHVGVGQYCRCSTCWCRGCTYCQSHRLCCSCPAHGHPFSSHAPADVVEGRVKMGRRIEDGGGPERAGGQDRKQHVNAVHLLGREGGRACGREGGRGARRRGEHLARASADFVRSSIVPHSRNNPHELLCVCVCCRFQVVTKWQIDASPVLTALHACTHTQCVRSRVAVRVC